MAISITDDRHVGLNDHIFPIIGRVAVGWLPRFANKINIGAEDFANEQYLSNWITKTLKGGIGTEEFVSEDRYWFGNLQTDFAGHMVLPPLATAVTLPTLPTITQAGAIPWTVDNASASRNDDATGWSDNFRNCLATVTITYAVTKYGAGSLDLHFHINDGAGDVATSASITDTGSGTITLSGQLGATASKIRVTATLTATPAGTSATVSALTYAIATDGTAGRFPAVFNSDTYFSMGANLYRIDNATGNVFLDALMPATITSLISSVGSMLYVFLGDSAYYWYRSSASPQVWQQTNSANANLGVHYAGKLWKINTTGQLAYAATPNAASPSWTNDALLTDNGLASGDCNNLTVSYSATGSTVIYADTKQGRFQHDVATGKFLATGLRLANHPNGGKGSVTWNDGDWVSAGLAIKKYVAGSTTVIADEGLNKDDGLPTEYAGEVVVLIDGLTHLYALVDASLTAGTGYSAIYRRSWDSGWKCWWDASLLDTPVTDKTMHFGIVSATYSYRFWFDHNGTIYYIPLSRENQNPKKVSGSTYSASGFLVSPWFDAGTKAFSKACKRITAFCEDMTATETAIISYRIDHATTALAATWTALTTIAADGATEFNLASGAGLAFKSFQYRIDLARGGTNTLSPDVQGLAVSYRKNLGAKHAWTFKVDLKDEGGDVRNKIGYLEAAAALNTWMEFVFRDSGKESSVYVEVADIKGETGVGPDYVSQYTITVVEV